MLSQRLQGPEGDLVRLVRLVRTYLQRTANPDGRSEPRVLHLSPVFRGMWDTTDSTTRPEGPKLPAERTVSVESVRRPEEIGRVPL